MAEVAAPDQETEAPTSVELGCPSCGNTLAISLGSDVLRTGASASPRRREVNATNAPILIPGQPRFDAEVLSLVAGGLTDLCIARELKAPLHRVKRSLREWMIKLDSPNRTSAAVRATQLGLLD